MDVHAEISRLRRRRANIRFREIASLMEAAGWERRAGKHSAVFSKSGRRPIVVPDHSGALKPGTALRILDDIEADFPKEGG